MEHTELTTSYETSNGNNSKAVKFSEQNYENQNINIIKGNKQTNL
jgi:hypothetical protein